MNFQKLELFSGSPGTDRACEVCALRQRALCFPVQHKTGKYELYYLIASNFDLYHSVKHILLLSCHLSLL